MEHVHEEQNRSSPRLSSKYSGLPLDHRARREKGTRVHTHLNGYANHLSNSEDQDEHGIKDSNNNVSNCNDDHSRGGGGGDDNDDDGVSRNSEENSDNSDDDRGNGDKDDENCDENCDSKYHNDDGGNTSHNVEDDFTCNNGGCAKSHTIQAPLSPNADETTVRSDETAESLTEELNVSLRFNSQHSIDEDTGNFSVENSNRNPASSNSINSNNDTSCENPNTRNDKKKANRFEVRNNAERSAERDGIAASQGARPKIVPQNPVLFDAHYQNGKIPSLETTGIDQIFLARHSTDPSLPQISFTESYDMYTSNDWTKTSITSNSSSSSLWNLPRSPAPERSGLVLENVTSRGLIPWYGDPMPVNYQPVTSMTGQFPNACNFSRDIDRLNWNENLPSNIHLTSFSSFGDFTAENGTQTASPSLRVSLLAPAVTPPSSRIRFPTATSQFSSSTMSGSVAPVTSTYDMLGSYGRERVGDFKRCRPSFRNNQANSGLTSPEMVIPERREESSRNHHLFNNRREGSHASVSLGDPSLVSLEQQVAEIDRVLKEREERTKRQSEAAQRHREIREKRQKEARERKEREERETREQEERERKERKQREIREREDGETRERELREMREREEREMREREEIENRERMERELEERRERETRIRHDRIVEESLPLQETPLWQCEHYQRRCSVKFPCCGVFHPCHRCHNLSGTCPADEKAHHATHVKCGNCGLEEEINEGSQNCRRCGLKLSEYFCPKCKHFTGVDKNPFHCEKCEICRIYKDRSFHCDVCNVCLDKRLKGKHKCRPNSGHDECCICLEDAFSGCQILPCSHKVHRECAIAMIQNGVRNCPICRHPLYGQLQQ